MQQPDALAQSLSDAAALPPDPSPDPPPDLGELGRLRMPPQSLEAEQSVLGALLIDNSAWERVTDLLTQEDFFRLQHRRIFAVLAGLLAEGKQADVITVHEQLRVLGQADDCGGLDYVNALAACVPSASNVRRYAEIVAERASLRSIIRAAEQAASAAYCNADAGTVLDDAKAAFARLADERKLSGGNRIALMGLDELRELARAGSYLVKHVIPSDSLGMLFGGSGTFKSFIALDLALHIAHGMPWMGRRTKQGPVLYIAAEGGVGLYARIVAWHRARRLNWNLIKANFRVIPRALDLTADAWRVVEAAQAAAHTPALVVIDTLSQTYAGEENSANEMAAYFRQIGERFRALWHCAVAILHHSGHQATERPRGSSAIRANLDWMLGVFRDEKEMLATLTCVKQKDGEVFDDATFQLSVQELGHDEDGDVVTSLVARHISSNEEMERAMRQEAEAGRGGDRALFLSLLQDGGLESALRRAFYDQCGKEKEDAKRQAYNRARSWAEKQGRVEVVGGVTIVTNRGA